MLGGFGLELPSGAQKGNQGEVNAHAARAKLPAKLAYCLNVGKGLDVADGSSNFGDNDLVAPVFA